MYHERTQKDIKQRRNRRLFALLCVLSVAIVCWLAYTSITANLVKQGEESVRSAILNSAKQCCAIEGSYPSSLEYLKENYGLVVNEKDYLITYTIFAENILPNVIVSAR